MFIYKKQCSIEIKIEWLCVIPGTKGEKGVLGPKGDGGDRGFPGLKGMDKIKLECVVNSTVK